MRYTSSPVAAPVIVALLSLVVGPWVPGRALADPCGMVPPIYVSDNTSLVRIGDQQTYVFYKEGKDGQPGTEKAGTEKAGIETFVIRPGFAGKVEDFGMLISFPTPPALRKVSEDIFPQIAKAIDPPEVVVDLRWRFAPGRPQGRASGGDRPCAVTVWSWPRTRCGCCAKRPWACTRPPYWRPAAPPH